MEDGIDVAVLPMLLAAGAWGRRPKDLSREIRYHFEQGYFVEGVQLQTMILGREAHTGSRLDLSMHVCGVPTGWGVAVVVLFVAGTTHLYRGWGN